MKGLIEILKSHDGYGDIEDKEAIPIIKKFEEWMSEDFITPIEVRCTYIGEDSYKHKDIFEFWLTNYYLS